MKIGLENWERKLSTKLCWYLYVFVMHRVNETWTGFRQLKERQKKQQQQQPYWFHCTENSWSISNENAEYRTNFFFVENNIIHTHTHAHRIYGEYIHADRVDSYELTLPKETNRTIRAKICWFFFVFTVVVVLVLWYDLTNSFSWLVHSATIVNNVFLQQRWMKFGWLTVLFAVFFAYTNPLKRNIAFV